ncbi:MAG: hypothetical protein HQM03_00520 [Magnetococcales bacterium]|nr:hypothetical protein [Magnetococcales bacterium]
MFNAIPAVNLLGVSNPLLEQTNLARASQNIRTHNAEQLSSRNVEDVKHNAKSRAVRRDHSTDEDEDETEEEGEGAYPQPFNKPSIQERQNLARQGKVSLNQRAVTAMFLNQAKSGGGKGEPTARGAGSGEPSIDVVA